jgi:two-component system cell cycle sensor histidine kinase/response regulator CckA
MHSAADSDRETFRVRALPRNGRTPDVVSRRVPALVWTTDSELRITSAAGAGLDRAGLVRGELEGRALDEIVGGSPAGCALIEAHAQALAGETVEAQLSLLGRDWSVEAQPLRDAGAIVGVLVLAVDVTEVKRAEGTLREAEVRYRRLVEHLPLVTYVNAMRDDSFTEWISPQIEELLGYPIEDWLHNPRMFPSVLHPDDRERVLDEIRLTRETGEPFRSEYRVRAQDGRTVWVYDETVTAHDDDGRPLFRQGVLLDVTERKEAEEALRAADTRYRALVEQLPLVVFTNLPGRDVRTSYISPQVERTLGYSVDDWLADTSLYERLVHPADRERVLEEVGRSREQGTRFSADFRMIARDGRTVWIHEECERVQDEHGDTLFSQGVWLDITAQKELEEQLRHAQKMDAIGRLAGGVAHDFNNLITAMTGYADLLLESLPPKDVRRFDVEQIGIAARRAAGLTQQLLAFSRKQVLHLQVLDLNEVVAAIDLMLRRLIGEDVRLASDLQPGLGRVRADLGQLEQVIVNLAVNARDAMPRGGKLTLETSEVELDEAYARERAEAVPQGRYVTLAVTDTGHGMDAETIQSVFEPFFTTKEAGRGTGLGLATVYGIVTQSGGHIDVTSAPGSGTTFRIYLPRVEDEAAPLPTEPAREAARGSETILLVEDEVMLRTLIRQQLERRGYTILEASTAADALALAGSHEQPIDLLLTDVVMPELSGFEVAAQVEAERPETRVLYITGYSERAVDDGLGDREDILPKPFTMDELACRVRDVLDARG